MLRPVKPIKLSELIEALEFDSEEHVTSKTEHGDGVLFALAD